MDFKALIVMQMLKQKRSYVKRNLCWTANGDRLLKRAAVSTYYKENPQRCVSSGGETKNDLSNINVFKKRNTCILEL